MKKLAIFTALLCLAMTLSAQGKFKGFFGGVPDFDTKDGERALSGKWLPRPAFSATAMQVPLMENSEPRFVNSFGAGIGYALFQNKEGEAYQVVAFTASVMFGTSEPLLAEPGSSETTIALGVTGWQYINFGIGYNFGIKQPVLLLNLVYSFN